MQRAFTIRDQHLHAFAAAALEDFEARMAAHARRFFPYVCGRLGEGRTREVIRRGLGRAHAHGLSTERELCLYLNLVFTFGPDFDVDPRLPWPARILRDPAVSTAAERIERLYEAGKQHASHGAGGGAR